MGAIRISKELLVIDTRGGISMERRPLERHPALVLQHGDQSTMRGEGNFEGGFEVQSRRV